MADQFVEEQKEDQEEENTEYIPKSQYLEERAEREKKVAKLAVQRNEARERLKSVQPHEANYDLIDKVVTDREKLRELATLYPDTDLEKVKALAKEKGLSVDEAFKIIGFDDVSKRTPQMGLQGKQTDTSLVKEYTMEDLKKAPMTEYNAIMKLVEEKKAVIKSTK